MKQQAFFTFSFVQFIVFLYILSVDSRKSYLYINLNLFREEES